MPTPVLLTTSLVPPFALRDAAPVSPLDYDGTFCPVCGLRFTAHDVSGRCPSEVNSGR